MERNTWMGWPSRLSLRRSPPDLVYTPIDVTSFCSGGITMILIKLSGYWDLHQSDMGISS